MVRAALRVVGLMLIAPLATPAYERPVTSHSIREAYFLGRGRDEKTAAFLAHYLRRLPLPKTGPHVAEIEIRTPYQQVVLRALQAPEGYSSLKAEQDYRLQPDRALVRVRINLTPTYSPSAFASSPKGFRPADFWRDFSIRLIQGEQQFQPHKVTGRQLYSFRGSLVGADVELEFDASQVHSAPATVEVLTPHGQRVKVEFDLEKLR